MWVQHRPGPPRPADFHTRLPAALGQTHGWTSQPQLFAQPPWPRAQGCPSGVPGKRISGCRLTQGQALGGHEEVLPACCASRRETEAQDNHIPSVPGPKARWSRHRLLDRGWFWHLLLLVAGPPLCWPGLGSSPLWGAQPPSDGKGPPSSVAAVTLVSLGPCRAHRHTGGKS